MELWKLLQSRTKTPALQGGHLVPPHPNTGSLWEQLLYPLNKLHRRTLHQARQTLHQVPQTLHQVRQTLHQALQKLHQARHH